jgi:hypothetical protein
MRLVNSEREPELVGVDCTANEVNEISKMVSKLNQDLVDSGFEQYQSNVVAKDGKVYIRQK